MNLSPELKTFISAHLADDTDQLLLHAVRYAGIDIPFAVGQIVIRQKIREKLPEWFNNDQLIFPSSLSAEQCSSEISARYKQRLIAGERVCDLTGGLGIDTWYFAQKATEVIYVERFAEYCTAAEANFKALGAENIRVINADSRDMADTLQTDTFYIDPARRADGNKRLFALTDCEPDILRLKSLLLENAKRLIIKISPMADMTETLRLLPETREIHVVAVKNECKELLFVLEKGEREPAEATIYTVNFDTEGRKQNFAFRPEEEKRTELLLTETVKQYLYEPNAALLKSGAFKLTASRLNLCKLHQHSHLYTSDSLANDFPGRIFQVEDTIGFSGKLLKQLSKKIPKASITTRNFPLTVAEFRKRSGISDGSDNYLFATTLSPDKRVIIVCKKIVSTLIFSQ